MKEIIRNKVLFGDRELSVMVSDYYVVLGGTIGRVLEARYDNEEEYNHLIFTTDVVPLLLWRDDPPYLEMVLSGITYKHSNRLYCTFCLGEMISKKFYNIQEALRYKQKLEREWNMN